MGGMMPFGRQEQALVGKALAVAEENVSDFYRISDAFWDRHPYDVRTLADLEPGEMAPKALAQVLRLRQPASERTWRPRDFYRVCLQDHNLMAVVRREKVGELFLPLLTYVLAHELVHIVRFYKFHHLYEAGTVERAAEETRVHALTSEILRKVPLRHLDRVINCYQEQEQAVA